jgi:CRP-like cAMP-binding protein
MDAHSVLRESPIFAALDDESIESLTQIATCRTVSEGDFLTVEGQDRALAMFFVLEGAVEVRREGQAIASLGPGDYFGEMALLIPDLPRSADVVATRETTVLQLTAWDIAPILHGHPEVAVAVIEKLARLLIEKDQKLAAAYRNHG